MNSIMQSEKRCFLCGRTGPEQLDRHHIFQSSLRNNSEKYGLVVYLCHDTCHENGKLAAHRCPQTRELLRQCAQRRAMEEFHWTLNDWMEHFYKNYLTEDEL